MERKVTEVGGWNITVRWFLWYQLKVQRSQKNVESKIGYHILLLFCIIMVMSKVTYSRVYLTLWNFHIL